MTLTEIQAQTTVTTATTGSNVDVSGITGDWTLKLNVSDQEDSTAANTPLTRFGFEDSVNGTACMAGPAASFLGKIEKSYDKVKSFKKADFPDLRLGQTGGLLRLKLLAIDGKTAAGVIAASITGSVTYRAWLEY